MTSPSKHSYYCCFQVPINHQQFGFQPGNQKIFSDFPVFGSLSTRLPPLLVAWYFDALRFLPSPGWLWNSFSFMRSEGFGKSCPTWPLEMKPETEGWTQQSYEQNEQLQQVNFLSYSQNKIQILTGVLGILKPSSFIEFLTTPNADTSVWVDTLIPKGIWESNCLEFQFNSDTQLCPTLCNPMDRSTPDFPALYHLPELAQIHVGDVIQTSHPLSSPSPVFSLSQHQGLSQWVSSLHQVAKVLDFQLQHQSSQWIFRTDFL